MLGFKEKPKGKPPFEGSNLRKPPISPELAAGTLRLGVPPLGWVKNGVTPKWLALENGLPMTKKQAVQFLVVSF